MKLTLKEMENKLAELSAKNIAILGRIKAGVATQNEKNMLQKTATQLKNIRKAFVEEQKEQEIKKQKMKYFNGKSWDAQAWIMDKKENYEAVIFEFLIESAKDDVQAKAKEVQKHLENKYAVDKILETARVFWKIEIDKLIAVRDSERKFTHVGWVIMFDSKEFAMDRLALMGGYCGENLSEECEDLLELYRKIQWREKLIWK